MDRYISFTVLVSHPRVSWLTRTEYPLIVSKATPLNGFIPRPQIAHGAVMHVEDSSSYFLSSLWFELLAVGIWS